MYLMYFMYFIHFMCYIYLMYLMHFIYLIHLMYCIFFVQLLSHNNITNTRRRTRSAHPLVLSAPPQAAPVVFVYICLYDFSHNMDHNMYPPGPGLDTIQKIHCHICPDFPGKSS